MRASPARPGGLRRAGSVGLAALAVATCASSFGARLAGASPPSSGQAAVLRPLAGCPRNLADELKSTGPARQLVTVNSPGSSSIAALLTIWGKRGACWVRLGGPWTARVGYNGISTHKVEGDGTTPAGAFAVGPVMYGNGPNPGVHYPYHHLVCGDWWDEDPASQWYNSFRHIACGARPAWTYGDSEPPWLVTYDYQSFAWIMYNTHPVVPGRGSAIFLHDGTSAPTTGCVSLAPRHLDEVLDWLRSSDSPRVVIGTDSEIRRY